MVCFHQSEVFWTSKLDSGTSDGSVCKSRELWNSSEIHFSFIFAKSANAPSLYRCSERASAQQVWSGMTGWSLLRQNGQTCSDAQDLVDLQGEARLYVFRSQIQAAADRARKEHEVVADDHVRERVVRPAIRVGGHPVHGPALRGVPRGGIIKEVIRSRS